MNIDITYQLMLPAVMFLVKLSHSYGWAIILLTVGVRLLVWPLVASSTKSMQRMQQMQAPIKELKDKYGHDPELYRLKTVEFYQANKMNPMGGCLPTLVQLPILIGLYATFCGPPFGDKPIDVKVNVVKAADAQQVKKAEVSSNSSAYVSPDGKLAKIVVFPGDSTIVEGSPEDFSYRAVEGTLPDAFKLTWRLAKPSEDVDCIPETGHFEFKKPGEYHIQALVPGIAKKQSFLFVNGLGKVAVGMQLLKPANWDILALILLFGGTMALSQKLMQPAVKKAPGEALDESQIVQQQTAKIMPFTITGMFFFMPMPAGVYLYMVVSNILQSMQTALIYRMPAAPHVPVADGPAVLGNGASSHTPPAIADNGSGIEGGVTLKETRKPKKKKK